MWKAVTQIRWLVSVFFPVGVSLAAPICASAVAQDPLVYSGGTKLKNQGTSKAVDVRVSFKIPCILCVGELITGGKITIGPLGGPQQVTDIVNEGLSQYDHDIALDPSQFTDPKGILDLSAFVFSQKTNGMKWGKTLTLTDDNGDPIKTQRFSGGFHVEQGGSTQYTFSNDGTDALFIRQFSFGRSSVLLETFSPSSVFGLMTFDNGGLGWMLGVDEELSFHLPFDLNPGEFLVADVVGTGAPGTPEALDVEYVQDHQTVTPEPSTFVLAVTGISALCVVRRRRKGQF